MTKLIKLFYLHCSCNKTIGFFRKLQKTVPRQSLLTIYKAFIRPHLDYGDAIFDQTYNASFYPKLESFQYNTALAITGAIFGTSKQKLYIELGLESLQKQCWCRKLFCLSKIITTQSPSYLFNLIPKINTTR